MPLGLPSSVVQPAATGSPQWVQHVVTSGVNIWSNHPIQAASSVVWIQLGLGFWLILAPRGRWSRLGGAATVGWGLVVWIFGEAFGGIFAPGATWLFGTPGAVLLYCVGGLLVALPERAFLTPRLGRIVLTLGGVFLIGMSVLQAWPGRGFWQGRGGTLPSMVGDMARTSQPGFLSSWVASFGSFDEAHGWAVNLFAVWPWPPLEACSSAAVAEPSSGGSPRSSCCVSPTGCWWRTSASSAASAPTRTPWCPWHCSSLAGYLAAFWVPVRAEVPAAAVDEAAAGLGSRRCHIGSGFGSGWSQRVTPAYMLRSFAALAALAVVVVGAAPMAAAAVNQSTDPILTQAVNGTPNSLDSPAPPFTLTDQHGQSVSLASLRGHTWR